MSDQNLEKPLISQDQSQDQQQLIENKEDTFKNLEIQPNNQEKTAKEQKALDEILEQIRNERCKKFLFMMGILGVAFQYIYYDIQGLLKKLIIQELDIDEIRFQLFISLPGFIGIPFSFLGGFFLDKIGYAQGFIYFSTVGAVGCWITAIGAGLGSFIMTVIGKTIFQVCLNLVMGAYGPLLSKWFQGGSLTQMSGYFEGTIKLAVMLGAMTYPRIAEVSDGIFYPFLAGTLFCTVFYLMGLLAPYMDIITDKKYQNIVKMSSETKRKAEMEIQNNKEIEEQNFEQHQEITQASTKYFDFSVIKQFDLGFWILIICFITNFIIAGLWSANYSTLIQQKFQLTTVNIGDILTIAGFVGLITPFLGTFMKKVDRQEYFILAASILCLFQYAYIMIHPQCEENCFANSLPISISYGLYLAIFTLVFLPAIAMQSPVKIVGAAYGIAFGLKNLTDAVVPMISVGPLLHNFDPKYTVLFLFLLSIFSFIFNSWWGYLIRQKRIQQEKQNNNY